ncbi:MAG TPA: glycoside hydrolase family 15 protein, partial [Spirochaetota bacterium]|nr:glycoside hydrolase family 15 protein [Spirochaetota bacterium]
SDCKNQITQSFLKTIIENEEYQSVYLYSNIDYNDILEQKNIIINSDIYFLLSYNQKILEPNIEKVFLEFERTKVYWLNWVDRTITFKKYSNEIIRSALTLKLLTYQKTGAILAAPTTSLPESIGEKRNWDYRFCWIRDASMIISTLTKIGHYKSAENYINFIISVIPFKEDKIQIMYGINGEKILEEKILNHLNGYYNSKPVRIGNQAYKQRQNDIYGVLIDVIYTHIISQEKNSQKKEHLWAIVRRLLYYVKRDWNKPDKGIWEIRSDKKHFTFSKVLCWVAFDRGSKIARHFGKEDIAIEWDNIKAIIKYNILKKSWNKTIGAFTQFYGSNDLDASNLLMQEYGFINADDPMYVATVKKTYESLSNDGLMYRYKNRDDFGKPSSSFIICSFWMIKSLFKIGERNLAKSLFENILNHSNHLGLYSEDMDFKTKRLLGNFPQGYSHLALIDTALLLSGES